jgi:hypothetical protein
VARRRYRSEAISQAGAAAHGRDPAGDTSLQEPITGRQEYGKPDPTAQPQGEAPSEPVTGLRDQLADMRQQQQNDALEQYINHYFPGAWPNERAALRVNHVWLANPGLVHAAGRIALERGVPRQSPEFLQAIGALIDQHHAAMMQAQPAPPPAPPMPSMPPMPPPVHHVDLEKVESPEGEPESAHMDAHYSAPVSRGDTGHSIEPEMSPSQVRLSPEERELCAMNKISETVYAAGKLKLAKQKAAKIRD